MVVVEMVWQLQTYNVTNSCCNTCHNILPNIYCVCHFPARPLLPPPFPPLLPLPSPLLSPFLSPSSPLPSHFLFSSLFLLLLQPPSPHLQLLPQSPSFLPLLLQLLLQLSHPLLTYFCRGLQLVPNDHILLFQTKL